MNGRLFPIIAPQLITLGSLKPRKLKPASNSIAKPTSNAACTTIGGNALGNMTLKIRLGSFAPPERDAVTNSSSLI